MTEQIKYLKPFLKEDARKMSEDEDLLKIYDYMIQNSEEKSISPELEKLLKMVLPDRIVNQYLNKTFEEIKNSASTLKINLKDQDIPLLAGIICEMIGYHYEQSKDEDFLKNCSLFYLMFRNDNKDCCIL